MLEMFLRNRFECGGNAQGKMEEMWSLIVIIVKARTSNGSFGVVSLQHRFLQ